MVADTPWGNTSIKLMRHFCSFHQRRVIGVTAVSAFVLVSLATYRAQSPTQWHNVPTLTFASWNMGAVNLNPFEYWVKHDDKNYEKLMGSIQERFDAPGSADVPLSDIFTETMFKELEEKMLAEGWAGVAETRQLWQDDFSKRKIISEFLKDRALGEKRLMSMPDRMTNTITKEDGKGKLFRPTPISSSDENLESVEKWWPLFINYMFVQSLTDTEGAPRVASLLGTIPRKKYPALTEEEERISVPLQTLCLALFDAVLVHTVNDVAAADNIDWHSLKQSLISALVRGKSSRAVEILSKRNEDVVFLQEVSVVFPDHATANPELNEQFHVLHPPPGDGKRNQQSIILVRRSAFPGLEQKFCSDEASNEARALGAEVADGDLFCVVVSSGIARKTMLASFHGDTNGLMTVRVAEAVFKTWLSRGGTSSNGPSLFIGMDANTHHVHSTKKQGVQDFYQKIRDNSRQDGGKALLRSVFEGKALNTTFNLRTALQPQLQKAVSLAQMSSSPLVDRNPKDHILYIPQEWSVVEGSLHRDNTGRGEFDEGIMPSLRWPSDHSMITVTMKRDAA